MQEQSLGETLTLIKLALLCVIFFFRIIKFVTSILIERQEYSSQEIHELRNMMSQLSSRINALQGSSNDKTILDETLSETGTNTSRKSLSPVLVRNKDRRKLIPMTRIYKKTLHVSYIFIKKNLIF